MADKYQKRYIAHQTKKRKVLVEMMKQRHSHRMFSEKEIPQKLIKEAIGSIKLCPSSCNRKAIFAKVVEQRDDKAFLGGILVGGVGWIHRAPKIVLLFADWTAYKENIDYMPYLDAGVVIYHLYLKFESLGLKACYVNPNVREKHQKFFRKWLGLNKEMIYCGAMAIGYEHGVAT
jgi:nitroreductase